MIPNATPPLPSPSPLTDSETRCLLIDPGVVGPVCDEFRFDEELLLFTELLLAATSAVYCWNSLRSFFRNSGSKYWLSCFRFTCLASIFIPSFNSLMLIWNFNDLF